MKKILLILAFLLLPHHAFATDGVCTANGQVITFGGQTIACGAGMVGILTVSTLPSCTSSIRGASYFVTDATSPVALGMVIGGGSSKVTVVCDGANWIVE